MNWTEHLTHQLLNQFRGDHFAPDIYDRLVKRDRELSFHPRIEVINAIESWQRRRLL